MLDATCLYADELNYWTAGCIVISLAFSKLYTFKTLNENELKKIE